MWLDIAVDRVVPRDQIRTALAAVLDLSVNDVLVTDAIETLSENDPHKVIAEITCRQGDYPQLVSLYLSDGVKPPPEDTPTVVGTLAEYLGAKCLVSVEWIREDELLEISGRDAVRVVDADDVDEH